MKRSIPSIPKPGNPRTSFDHAVKEILETITGQRGDRITPLADTATTAEIAAKVNEILARLQ